VLTDYRIPKGKLPLIAKWLGVGESSLYRYLTQKPPGAAVKSRIYHHRGVPIALWGLPPETLQANLYLFYLTAHTPREDTQEDQTHSLEELF
jgi:hypothetical protein